MMDTEPAERLPYLLGRGASRMFRGLMLGVKNFSSF